MSQFLAPIHQWLFDKIIILEHIEKEILSFYDQGEVKALHEKIVEETDDFIPDQPLENLIDQSNIHGWLQNRITLAETRQAALVNELISLYEDAPAQIEAIYFKVGTQLASEFDEAILNPSDVFKALNNILLEGMPCDRVNKVVEESDERFIWNTSICVHKDNWESKGVKISHYYKFRAALIQGFVSVATPTLTYKYQEEEQLHTIKC
jgi:hypothetical protein